MPGGERTRWISAARTHARKTTAAIAGANYTTADTIAATTTLHGSVKIDLPMMAGNVGRIMEEVVKYLVAIYGADV